MNSAWAIVCGVVGLVIVLPAMAIYGIAARVFDRS